MAEPYTEVADYIEAQGLGGGATGWSVLRGTMPESPDAVIAVFAAGGPQPEFKYALSYPSVQVRVRGDVRDAYTKLEAIRDALVAVRGAQLGSGQYVFILPQSDILPLGQDTRARHEYTLTFRTGREPA